MHEYTLHLLRNSLPKLLNILAEEGPRDAADPFNHAPLQYVTTPLD